MTQAEDDGWERIAIADHALMAAAAAYGKACDERQYPALSRLVRELKEAARRYRWAVDGIEEQPMRYGVVRRSTGEKK